MSSRSNRSSKRSKVVEIVVGVGVERVGRSRWVRSCTNKTHYSKLLRHPILSFCEGILTFCWGISNFCASF